MRFIAAMMRDRIEASCLPGGWVDGQVFPAWVQTVLVPPAQPSDVVKFGDALDAGAPPSDE